MTDNKEINTNKKRIPLSTKVTTILLIVISVLSVLTIIVSYRIQNLVKTNSDESDKWFAMLSVVGSDINKIMIDDTQKQQMAMTLKQDVLFLNEWIGEMKTYNETIQPFSYNQSDINKVAMQAATEISLLNLLIMGSYAYDWTIKSGGNSSTNYVYRYDGIEVQVIRNIYSTINESLEPEIKYWLNATYYPDTPEVLQIDLYEWETEIYWNASIVLEYGQYTSFYSTNLRLNITETSYWDISWIAGDYEWVAELYDHANDLMTTALLIMTTSAVILAYVVSIRGRKYIWISLIIGIIVSLIGLYTFTNAITAFMDAQM
ncbi:MAG: hypothetical protein ACTSRC_11125 [Candidatus Helarchaeota archaeon]